MTHRGPFQPQTLCDSVINLCQGIPHLLCSKSHSQKSLQPSKACGPCFDVTDTAAPTQSCESWDWQTSGSRGQHRGMDATICREWERKHCDLHCWAVVCKAPRSAHRMGEEGRNQIPFSESFSVTCNSSFTRDGQAISLKAKEIFIKLRMDFSAQDNVLSVIVILM